MSVHWYPKKSFHTKTQSQIILPGEKDGGLPENVHTEIVGRVCILLPVSTDFTTPSKIISTTSVVPVFRKILISHLPKIDPFFPPRIVHTIFFPPSPCWVQFCRLSQIVLRLFLSLERIGISTELCRKQHLNYANKKKNEKKWKEKKSLNTLCVM